MSEPQPSPLTVDERHARKRRIVWVLSMVLLLAAIVLTPPFLNVNRLQHRIAASVSQSLGRPVHLDQVSLHVLPTPGFTLQNLVVSEDPSFGAEPVIRAQVVNASIRVSSLWRRQVEFGTIHFEDPSVNLVRRADGRWNVESILLHAAQEEVAPTGQQKAGPAPRFPYIEATGARLNVKMEDEKKPFALTEADFALWLPSPQQWRLRLNGKPTRTDTNVADTGQLTVEAALERASQLADVPVEVTAAWRRVPLGEASHILSGSDMGWRGDVELITAAHGTLSNAALSATLKLTNVRRADFIPAKMLALDIECNGHLAMTDATVTEPACTMPASDTGSASNHHGVIAATANKLDLASLHSDGARLGMTNVSGNWLLAWAELFSQRIPESTTFPEEFSGSVARSSDHPSAGLQGEFHSTKVQEEVHNDGAPSTHQQVPSRNIAVKLADATLTLSPINLSSPDQPTLTLSGSATNQLYEFQFSGSTTQQEIASLRALVPPLGDGVEQALPALSSTSPSNTTIKVSLVCTRSWGSPQTCVSVSAPDVTNLPRKIHRR